MTTTIPAAIARSHMMQRPGLVPPATSADREVISGAQGFDPIRYFEETGGSRRDWDTV
jgi:hypothetical protein